MQQVLGALLGVPATMLVAGGLGLVGVAVFSRLLTRRSEPIRWGHIGLGLIMFVAGTLLVFVEILLFGAA